MAQISIIIRTKNEEKWICHCLAMIEKQSFTDFEIILVFHSKVDNLMEKMKRHGELPFTVVADPSYFYYKKYGLERSAIKFIKALILKFPLALSALLKGYIPLSIDGFIDIATADFFLDKNGVVLNAKYSVKDIFDGFKFEEIKQFSL